MTTDIREHHRAIPASTAARLGAISSVAPVTMFVAWIAINGWSGSIIALVQAIVEVSFGALVAGWIVGRVVDGSIRRWLIGLITFGVVAWWVILPLNAIGSTWEELRTGHLSGPFEVLFSAGGYLFAELINSLYGFVLFLPFGAGWIGTLSLLRRASR